LKDTARQLIRFALVGVAGLLVDVAVLYLLAPLCGWYAGRVLSFIAAATCTWLLNRTFTFEPTGHAPVWREYLHYLVSMLGGAAVNYLTYVLTLHWLDIAAAPAVGVALGSLAGMTVNFTAARYFVFRPRKGS